VSSKAICLYRTSCWLLYSKSISSHLESESAYTGILYLLWLCLIPASIRNNFEAFLNCLEIWFHRDNSSWLICNSLIFMCRNFRVGRNRNYTLIWKLVRKIHYVSLATWVFKTRKSHMTFASESVLEFKRLLDWGLNRKCIRRMMGKASCALCFFE